MVRPVGDLDETIEIIRSAIFGLRAREGGAGTGLWARVVRVVGEAAQVLGFTPSLRMEGLLDTPTCRARSPTTSRAADRTDVVLETDGREVRLTVPDDGVDIPDVRPPRSPRNMAERAGQLGGAPCSAPGPSTARCRCGTSRCPGIGAQRSTGTP